MQRNKLLLTFTLKKIEQHIKQYRKYNLFSSAFILLIIRSTSLEQQITVCQTDSEY